VAAGPAPNQLAGGPLGVLANFLPIDTRQHYTLPSHLSTYHGNWGAGVPYADGDGHLPGPKLDEDAS